MATQSCFYLLTSLSTHQTVYFSYTFQNKIFYSLQMNFSYPPVLVLESINTKLFQFFNYVNTLTKTMLKTVNGIIIVIFQTTRQTPDKAHKNSKDPSEIVGC